MSKKNTPTTMKQVKVPNSSSIRYILLNLELKDLIFNHTVVNKIISLYNRHNLLSNKVAILHIEVNDVKVMVEIDD
jgi:hypothetical protein